MANIVFQWLMIACTSLAHPFFVSLTDISLDKPTHTLEISQRIFTDDFENTLRKNYPGKMDILHPQDQEQMNKLVNDYIQKHLQLQVNGKAVVMSFVGYEQENESIWTYFEVKDIAAVQKLTITNSILQDYSSNQINIIHARVDDEEKNTKLDYPDTRVVFDF